MRRSKTIIVLLLVAALTLALFTGCSKSTTDTESKGSDNSGTDIGENTGNNDNTGSEGTDDKKNTEEAVKLVAVFPGTQPECQPEVLEAINKKLVEDGLNINVDIKYIDDYWNKLALDIAGGTVYDLAWAHSSTLSDLVAKKVYQPIDEAMEKNAPELLEKMPEYLIKGGSVAGKLYAIPRNIPMTAFNNVYNVRGDLREKYGLPEITDIKGLEAFMEAVQKNDPDVFPIVGSNLQPLYPVYANYFFPIGDGGKNPVYIDPADPNFTVKSFWDSDAFTKVAEKAKEWRDKGYQPADTSSIENMDTGFDYGKVAVVPANIMRASERIDTITANVPGVKVETVLLEPEKRYVFLAGDNMLAVPSTSKNVDKAVALINWIKGSQENYDLWSYGVEGENYKLVNGAVDVNDIPGEKRYTTNVWMWNDIELARFSSNYPKEDIEKLKVWDQGSEVTPFVGFTVDQSNIKTQVSQITAVMNEYYENIGLGVLDINEVRDEIMDKMWAAGLQDVIDEVQRQINEYVK
ncbi:MAG TPA: ABC transporter substrate-binding protein [Clostridiales bacterium]|nr:ABC transporter substrate-binding protein [Clostridiales bacterium]